MELPIGVFAIAVATVVYPLIARHAAERNYSAMADDYHKGLRLILMINLPAAAGLALLSEPIVRLLLQHGKFGPADTRAMVPLLALFAVGMPFFSTASLITRAFYALKDTVTPVKVATGSFVINVALSWFLKRDFGAAGLVLASTLAVLFQTLALQHLLARRIPGMRFGNLWLTIGKVVAASLIMSVAVGAGWWLLQRVSQGRTTGDLIAIFGLIPAAVGLYAGALWSFRVDGRDELAATVRRKLAKLSGAK
jgi:putative peptidoglycan lipid II flippase